MKDEVFVRTAQDLAIRRVSPETPDDGEIVFLTAGVDVQTVGLHRILHVVVSEWTALSYETVVAAQQFYSWQQLERFLGTFRVVVDSKKCRRLPIKVCAIDLAYLAGEVKEFLGRTIKAEVGGKVKLVGVRFSPNCSEKRRVRKQPTTKRIDPVRPHIRKIAAFDLNRNHWMHQVLGRDIDLFAFHEDCPVPSDWASHHRANELVAESVGKGGTRLVWVRRKDRDDSWVACRAFAHAAAGLFDSRLKDIPW